MPKYTWNASDYQKHSQAQQQWARELIAKLNLKGDELVLDVGCGDGKVTAEIAACVPRGSAIGVDNSVSMIELAKSKFPADKQQNLSFRIMDAGSLSFDEEFDVAFSNAALHWIKDHRPALSGLFKSLKAGGRMLLQMGGKGNAERVIGVFDELRLESVWQPYFSDFEFPYGFHGPEEYSQWLSQAGFQIKRVELIPKDMTQEGAAGLAGWIRTTWLPYTERVPEEKRNAFISELADRYLRQVQLDAEGKAHVAMVRLEVEAVKRA
jgi:trans-aconitate 2-methyltransferase